MPRRAHAARVHPYRARGHVGFLLGRRRRRAERIIDNIQFEGHLERIQRLGIENVIGSENPSEEPPTGEQGSEAGESSSSSEFFEEHCVTYNPADPQHMHGTLRRGQEWCRWLEDPNEPGCTVDQAAPGATAISMTRPMYQGRQGDARNPIVPFAFREAQKRNGWPQEYDRYVAWNARGMGPGRTLPVRRGVGGVPVNDEPEILGFPTRQWDYVWNGRVGEGYMWTTLARREKEAPDPPHMGEILQAIYSANHNMDTLRVMGFDTVINTRMEHYLIRHLYQNRKYDPPLPEGTYGDKAKVVWAHGTPEFYQLMGLPFGRLISNMLLRSFPRGTRRVKQVNTLYGGSFDVEYIIEPIGSSVGDDPQPEGKVVGDLSESTGSDSDSEVEIFQFDL